MSPVRPRPGLFATIDRAAGAPTGIIALTAFYAASAILQGAAFVLAIPLLRQLFGGGSAPLAAWISFAACVVLAFASHLTGMMRSARISVYAVCDRILRRLGDKVARIALGWFDSGSSARIATAMAKDVQTLSHLGPVVLPGVITGVLTPMTVAVAALFIEPWVGVALIVAVPIGVVCIRWSMRLLARLHPLEQDADVRMSAAVLESAALQPLLRASGRTGLRWEHLADAVANDSDAELTRMRAEGRPSMVFQLATQLCFAAAIVAAAVAVAAGGIDVATFAMLCLMAVRCVEPLTLAVQYADELFRDRAAATAIIGILDAPELPEPARPRRPDSFDVAFANATFGYRTDEPIIQAVDLEVTPGGMTALVGPSGAGKSTLARLAARFWDVDEGSVRVGGIDVREIGSEELLRQVAFVFQNVFLFDMTIRENIRIGRPGATDAEVADAAHAARLDEVVERLPQGWDTPVGQGGSLLSGGERQRVAIARALLKQAPILLLDEITSALDAENEAALTRALQDYARERTVIMIAHRGTAIAAADRVLALQNGRVSPVEDTTG